MVKIHFEKSAKITPADEWNLYYFHTEPSLCFHHFSPHYKLWLKYGTPLYSKPRPLRYFIFEILLIDATFYL